ncbi:MAG TPA: NAD(P)-binding domain-containing protein, partial [Pyrinomonadaceae bacterium]
MNEVQENKQNENHFDVAVIGGGQAGLSIGFYLRRTGFSYVILDAQEKSGGAWLRAWNSLHLFSPARWSSLPGWLFPGNPERYPSRDEVIDYLVQYENRYQLPVLRPVKVNTVSRNNKDFVLDTTAGDITARAIVSANGTWQNPFVPFYPGQDKFEGLQIHSAFYQSPEQFAGQNVL